MKSPGIYQIQSIAHPERCYIGSAVNVRQRWHTHRSLLQSQKHQNRKLQNHYNKYGETDLVYSVLLGCEKSELLKNEQFFIDSYNPWFNISKIAGSLLGMKFSDETKALMSKAHMGNKYALGYTHSEESKLKMSEAGKRMVFSPEHRRKLSERQMGEKNHNFRKHPSEETRIKIGLASKGNKHRLGAKLTDEHKAKIGQHSKGKPRSEETKRKISLSHFGIKQTPESREKMRKSHLGVKPSEETRKKMSEAQKRRHRKIPEVS